MTDEPDTAELENRIDKLESTIEKMMPSRRDALKMGGAALVGGAAMSGTASAGTTQVGTIGSQASPVDLESEDINNADTVTTDTLDSTTQNNSGTVTTQDLVVNGTATGPFGGGGIQLSSGDSITVKSINKETTSGSFVTLYSGSTKDVLGGNIVGMNGPDFRYKFSDGSNITKNSGVGETAIDFGNESKGQDREDVNESTSVPQDYEIAVLPPAKDVVLIEVGQFGFGVAFGAEVILLD